MAEVFVDTSGWATFFVRTEPLHAVAVACMCQWRAEGTHVITTNYVLTELMCAITPPHWRQDHHGHLGVWINPERAQPGSESVSP